MLRGGYRSGSGCWYTCNLHTLTGFVLDWLGNAGVDVWCLEFGVEGVASSRVRVVYSVYMTMLSSVPS